MDEELLAEIDEYSGLTAYIDTMKENMDIPYWMRQKLDSHIKRRTYPNTQFTKLDKVFNTRACPVAHVEIKINEQANRAESHMKLEDE